MTDRTKFEQMLEHLINEEQDKASELFHELVVSKSREIYENILSDSFGDEDEGMGGDDDHFDDEHDIGGDETDDFIDDMGSDEDEGMGGDDEDSDVEDRLVDLEDALDDLRAEFEELMAKESGESDHDDDFGDEEPDTDSDDFGDEEPDTDSEDFGDEESDSDGFDDEEDFTKESFFREFVEPKKVTIPKGGDDGANTKSVVAKPNRMGGSSANITRGGEEKTGGTKGGLLNPSVKVQNFNSHNTGGDATKTAFKTRQPGHGAEKKGTRDGATDTKSVVSGGNKGGKR